MNAIVDRPITIAAAAALALLTAAGAKAQCVTLDPVTLSQAYNPFATTQYAQTIRVTAHRHYDAFYGNPTNWAAKLDKLTADTRSYDVILLRDDDGGSGKSVLYDLPTGALNYPNDYQIDLAWGAFSPESRTFDLELQIPAGQDWPAGTTTLTIGTYYQCKWGGFTSYPYAPAYLDTGLIINMTTSSAVQASLVGQVLDFGELSAMTTADVAVAAETSTKRSTNLRVASSGPYEVRVDSTNAWVMTPNGGAATLASQRIRYQLEMLGQRLDSTHQTFTPVSCQRAGVAGQLIGVVATLQEGGVGKSPSSIYKDVVTITVTPLAAGSSAQGCS